MTNDEPKITIVKGPRGPFTVDHEIYEIEGDPNGHGGTIRLRESESTDVKIGRRRLVPFREIAHRPEPLE